jgi:predicted O-methyltransferase YrrM
MSLFARLRFYPTSLALRLRIASARKLLRGDFRWHALDALGIPGFGTDLIRVDFPPDPAAPPRWGNGRAPHAALAAILDAGQPGQLDLLRASLATAGDCRAWPENEDPRHPELPWRDNLFLDAIDSTVLHGLLRHLRPSRYLEIGSGMSTRVAWQARQAGGFPMEIVSVDPEPRLAVSTLCDRVRRRRLEDVAEEFLALVTPDTVVFFDGSHRSFPASDVTVFFLELLPRFPAGTIVHIHDIFLPDDYPPKAFNRLWSEQYLLATWLLGGAKGLKVLLPCAHLAQAAAARPLLTAALGAPPVGGSSFWLQKT